jgi:hypothetical protein
MALSPRRTRVLPWPVSFGTEEINAIVTSSDPNVWDDPANLQRPAEPWELVQLGNCGSPIETPAGWIC